MFNKDQYILIQFENYATKSHQRDNIVYVKRDDKFYTCLLPNFVLCDPRGK